MSEHPLGLIWEKRRGVHMANHQAIEAITTEGRSIFVSIEADDSEGELSESDVELVAQIVRVATEMWNRSRNYMRVQEGVQPDRRSERR